jgi:hypothetical protein
MPQFLTLKPLEESVNPISKPLIYNYNYKQKCSLKRSQMKSFLAHSLDEEKAYFKSIYSATSFQI